MDAVAEGRGRGGAVTLMGEDDEDPLTATGDLVFGDRFGDPSFELGFLRFRRKDFVVPATADVAMDSLSPVSAASLAFFTLLSLARLPFFAIDLPPPPPNSLRRIFSLL